MTAAIPTCPEHKTEMHYSTSNRDQREKFALRGKEIENKFHYCQAPGCNWRYSFDLGDYFKADELPAAQPKSRGSLFPRK